MTLFARVECYLYDIQISTLMFVLKDRDLFKFIEKDKIKILKR